MFATDLVFSLRDLGLNISFNSEIVTKRLHSYCFKLLESDIPLLGTGSHNNIAAANCKTSSFMRVSSVTCNALWEH